MGMDFDKAAPVVGVLPPDIGDPKTSVLDLWKIALAKGANKSAVATINYDKTGYEFKIKGSSVSFECDSSGKPKP